IRPAGGDRACPWSRPRSTDARPNDVVRSLPQEPDGTHFWPWRASLVGTQKLYTISVGFVKFSSSTVLTYSLSVYKEHEIRGLRPRRRFPGRKTHAFLGGMA